VSAEMRATMWAVHPRRILTVTLCSATLSSLVNAHAAFAANKVASGATTTTTNGGLLIGLGAVVLILGLVGFVVITYSRKKRRPTQCSDQRDALAAAERALQYWEGALAHIQAVDRDRFSARANGIGDGTELDDPTSPDVDHESLRTKSQSGFAAAVKYREQCQLDLINCMASGGGNTVPIEQLLPQHPASPFDQK
jgi:hypothetical protein